MAERDVEGTHRTEAVKGRGPRRAGTGRPAMAGFLDIATLQATAGNAATTVAVQRLTFRTTHMIFSSKTKPVEALSPDEKKARKREIDVQSRWKNISNEIAAWPTGGQDPVQDAIQDVRAGLQWLDAATVDDWDLKTLTAAQAQLTDVEQKLTAVEAAVETRRKAAKLEEKRAAAEQKFRAAVGDLGPLLSLSPAEELLLTSEEQDGLRKNKGRVHDAMTFHGDTARAEDYISAALAVAQSVDSTRPRLEKQIKTVNEFREVVRRAREDVTKAREEVYDALEALENLEDLGTWLHQEAVDVQAELTRDDKDGAPDPSKHRPDLLTGWYNIVRPRKAWKDGATTAVTQYLEVVNKHEKAWATTDTLDLPGLKTLLNQTNSLLQRGTQQQKDLEKTRAAVVDGKLDAKLKAYRHLRSPSATTAPGKHAVAVGPGEPATVEHEGNTYILFAPGASLYGRLAVDGLASNVRTLFADALGKGVIPAMGTGHSGVKIRGSGVYEIKVRRTILVANHLDPVLRIRNTAAPVTVSGRNLITFDQVGLGH